MRLEPFPCVDDILSDLAAGLVGGMGIRPDRNLKVNFSIPYDHTGMSIVAHKERAAGFKSLEDFNRPE